MRDKRLQLMDFGRALIELNNRATGWLLLVFILGLFVTGVLSNFLYDILANGTDILIQAVVPVTVACGALVMLAYWLFQVHIRTLQISTAVTDASTIDPRRGLVWILSPQQVDAPLMVINYHRTKLTHVWVILVKGDSSTQKTLEMLRGKVHNAGWQITIEPVMIDRHDVESTYNAVNMIFREMVPAAGLQADDVVVDITGGLRPMTAGLIVACSFHNFTMQYLSSDRDIQGNVIEGTQRIVRVDIDLELS